MTCVYLIGSLRDPRVPEVGNYLEKYTDLEIFSDWYSASEDADDWLRDYYKGRGYNYKQMVYSHAAKHIFAFDLHHLDRSCAGVLVAPAGKSCHLELGYLRGQGKPVYVLFHEEPDRVDVMYNFCNDIFFDKKDLMRELKRLSKTIS